MELQSADINRVSSDLELMGQAVGAMVEGILEKPGPAGVALGVAVGGVWLLSKIRSRGAEHGS